MVVLLVQNGDTTSNHLPLTAAEMYDSVQYAAYVPPILTYNAPFVCVYVTGLTGNMSCDIQDAVQMQAVLTLILSSTDGEQTV
jgi:hypothetical protein